MHKILPLLLITFLISNQITAQEKGRFGLRFGYNSSVFSASVNSESSSKGGLNIGAFIDFKTSRNFHVQPEINYSSQGELENYTFPQSGTSYGKTTVTLNYLNIPLIFKVDVTKVFNFQFGPQVGLLLSGREKGTIDNEPVDDNLKDVFKSDFAIVGGVGFNIGNHFNLGARLNYGVTNIYTAPAGAPSDFPSISNRVLNIFAGVTF